MVEVERRRVVMMIVMLDFEIEVGIESQSTRWVEWLVERNKVRRRRSLEVKRNILVETLNHQMYCRERKVVDLILGGVELQSQRGRANEGDNYGKGNLRVDCSWLVRAF